MAGQIKRLAVRPYILCNTCGWSEQTLGCKTVYFFNILSRWCRVSCQCWPQHHHDNYINSRQTDQVSRKTAPIFGRHLSLSQCQSKCTPPTIVLPSVLIVSECRDEKHAPALVVFSPLVSSSLSQCQRWRCTLAIVITDHLCWSFSEPMPEVIRSSVSTALLYSEPMPDRVVHSTMVLAHVWSQCWPLHHHDNYINSGQTDQCQS